ncbi:TetR/AcrR family transcriptional regulator [Nocardioides humi]|uniref:TetR/AcrR family transcriptional regulator n=1 Tax=Nocardioides humi TaxID=449461 RepID=A0ABN2ALD2_9ACTN|nr:TetR/AcrR family transcriptional regulator [Nocardioides humi]
MARPRDTRIDDRVVAAWRALADELPYDDITMEAVAERARVGKPSLYRRYPNKARLAFAASIQQSVPVTAVDTGSLRNDLLEHVAALARSLDLTPRSAWADQLATAIADHDFAGVLSRFDEQPLQTVLGSWDRALARGEVKATVDARTALNDLAGTLIFHVLVRHLDADTTYRTLLVDRFLHGVCAE